MTAQLGAQGGHTCRAPFVVPQVGCLALHPCSPNSFLTTPKVILMKIPKPGGCQGDRIAPNPSATHHLIPGPTGVIIVCLQSTAKQTGEEKWQPLQEINFPFPTFLWDCLFFPLFFLQRTFTACQFSRDNAVFEVILCHSLEAAHFFNELNEEVWF